MTAAEKKQRVDGKKSLVLSGLLLQQAKLLRERLQNQEIECHCRPRDIEHWNQPCRRFSGPKSSHKRVQASVAFALIALVVVGASLFGYNEIQKQKVSENVKVL